MVLRVRGSPLYWPLAQSRVFRLDGPKDPSYNSGKFVRKMLLQHSGTNQLNLPQTAMQAQELPTKPRKILQAGVLLSGGR